MNKNGDSTSKSNYGYKPNEEHRGNKPRNPDKGNKPSTQSTVSNKNLRANETTEHPYYRLLLEKNKIDT